jgi:integrase
MALAVAEPSGTRTLCAASQARKLSAIGATFSWRSIADQLGHADVEMVFRVYGKFSAADFQRPKATGKA